MTKKLLLALLFGLAFISPASADHHEKKDCNCKGGETCSGEECTCEGECDCKDCPHKTEDKGDHEGHDHE